MYRLLYRFQTGPEILRRLPSVRLSFPSQGLGRAESRENREGAPGRQVGLRAAARGLETDGPELPPTEPLDLACPLPVGWCLLRLPRWMTHGPGKWALLLREPQKARPRATSASEEPLMQSGACRTPVPDTL